MKQIMLIAIVLVLCTSFVQADSVTITNSVSTKSSTGGNSSNGGSGGTVTEGQTHSEVYIHSEVNGQVVEDLHEARNDGTPIVVEVHHDISTSSETSVVVDAVSHANLSTSSGSNATTESRGHNRSTSSRPQRVEEPKIPTVVQEIHKGTTTNDNATTTIGTSTSRQATQARSKSVGVRIKAFIQGIFRNVTSLFKH